MSIYGANYQGGPKREPRKLVAVDASLDQSSHQYNPMNVVNEVDGQTRKKKAAPEVAEDVSGFEDP